MIIMYAVMFMIYRHCDPLRQLTERQSTEFKIASARLSVSPS
ncbi:MAG TPA: hypothetical protein VJL83_00710 [Patescibacteria group bacterium]|nr:hypothetical protein [Patescibacteria group bacterium]